MRVGEEEKRKNLGGRVGNRKLFRDSRDTRNIFRGFKVEYNRSRR